ncbi:MAG TPA: hypothetical protein VFJ58_06525 [Armatimonadota bacterium]|nr:hypothetical protein [Armatimonadota bacterium]
MLSVMGVHAARETAFEFDPYVPLVFRCFDTADDVPLYWIAGNSHDQLMEVGLHPLTGAICKVVATSLGREIVHSNDSHSRHPVIAQGVPICDVSGWDWDPYRSNDGARFREEALPFCVVLGRDFLSIAIEKGGPANGYYRAGRMLFGVDSQNDVCRWDFTSLSPQEITNVRAAAQL